MVINLGFRLFSANDMPQPPDHAAPKNGNVARGRLEAIVVAAFAYIFSLIFIAVCCAFYIGCCLYSGCHFYLRSSITVSASFLMFGRVFSGSFSSIQLNIKFDDVPVHH